MTLEEFIAKTGRKPEADDLDRVNCLRAGQYGHMACGWCAVCDAPAFECLRYHAVPHLHQCFPLMLCGRLLELWYGSIYRHNFERDLEIYNREYQKRVQS